MAGRCYLNSDDLKEQRGCCYCGQRSHVVTACPHLGYDADMSTPIDICYYNNLLRAGKIHPSWREAAEYVKKGKDERQRVKREQSESRGSNYVTEDSQSDGP